MTSQPDHTTVVLSVVIPCSDSAPQLLELLDSLADEDVSFEWEVVVADNGSTDDTAEMILDHRRIKRLRVIHATEKRGPAYARNTGVAHAVGRYVCFVDDDDVVAPGYLEKMRASIERDGFVGATMDGVYLNEPWVVAAMRGVPAAGLDAGPWPWHSAGMLGLRRELFERVGGFDEDFNPGEDADLCWRVQHETGTVLRLSEAVVWHRWRDSPLDMFRQGRWHGTADPHLLSKWAYLGMRRPRSKTVLRRWASCAGHLLGGIFSKAHRGRGLFLFGLSVGHVEGSVRYRVIYL